MTVSKNFCYQVSKHFLQIDKTKEATNDNKGRLENVDRLMRGRRRGVLLLPNLQLQGVGRYIK
jgi:hypothetical protein